jgi:teichoic acid transport system permease protein
VDRSVSDSKTPVRDEADSGRGARGRLASGLRAHGTGRVISPGQLAEEVDVIAPDLEGLVLADYAVEHGLRPSAERPGAWNYIEHLWQRRHFMIAFATARNIAMYTEAKLGQLWQILTPILNAGVYFLIFGLLLHIDRGIPNYLAFLVTGVFVFNFTQRAFISTSRVIVDSLPLIRALQFPRASLPLAYVIIELQQMVLSMAVLTVIVLCTGEPLTWYWLLAIPALLLQTIFNAGVGLFVARLGSQVNDFSQLLPFLMRTWLYVSGVLYSISTLSIRTHPWIVTALELNPAALYITLVRNAVLRSQRLSQPGSQPYNAARCHLWSTLGHEAGDRIGHTQTLVSAKYQYYSAYCHAPVNPDHFWYYATGWAVLAIVAGFFFFWRAETRYGRG